MMQHLDFFRIRRFTIIIILMFSCLLGLYVLSVQFMLSVQFIACIQSHGFMMIWSNCKAIVTTRILDRLLRASSGITASTVEQ